jgi:DNA-binding MarR family transcriptional regulator
MNQKHIGILLIGIGICIAVLMLGLKAKEDAYIEAFTHETGSCYLADGTCLHEDRNVLAYVVGGAISLAVILFGIYLIIFDKTQTMLLQNNREVAIALKQARIKDDGKQRWEAFLAGFSPDEQTALKAIKDQDGITQSTLRFKTRMSKTSLSLLLAGLESRGHISRKDHARTKQVFMVKRF